MSVASKSDVESRYPLTPAQSAMLFHSLYAPGAGMYIEQVTCDMRESLDVHLLEQAWARVTQRHAALRTRFQFDGSTEPVQEVLRRGQVPITLEDWRDIDFASCQTRLETFQENDLVRDFDPSGVPMRLTLLQMSPTHHCLLWTFHHALLDGRSARIVMRDLFDFYDALVVGRDLEPSPPPRFGDYVAWLRGQDQTASKEYWQQALAGVARTPLIVERASGTEQGQAVIDTSLSRDASDTLRLVARENRLTMNTLLQGAWAYLLSQYNGLEDVVFAATRALRGPAFERSREVVGVLINTIPMRVAVPPEGQWLAWLQGLRSQWIEMRPFELAALPDIIRWSGAPAETPWLSSLVVCENRLLNSELASEGKARQFKSRSVTNYPLTVVGFAEPQWVLKIGYQRSCFDEATVFRMLGHLQNSLEHLAENLHQPLKNQVLLTEPEQHQLLHEWQATERRFPDEDCVHRLFECQVERTPDAVAVTCDGNALTYRALNQRANQLTHHLQNAGVGADARVGICLSRSPDAIAAIIAVHKAGGAYLLLDADYPQQRLESMIREAGLAAIITVDESAARWNSLSVRTICLDRDAHDIAQEKMINPLGDANLDHLAYAVFTSGSSGQPKGILITHRSLTNHTLALIDQYEISAADRRLQLVSMNSDVVIAEVFPYLLTGGTLVIRPDLNPASVPELLKCLDEEKITVVGTPSDLWHEWVRLMADDEVVLPAALRVVIAGMDRVRPDLFALWKNKVHRRIRWFNAYGPTEATCTTTVYEADLSSDEVLASVPIGRPIANAQVYLLDGHQRPVPIGIPGELYVGGAGLALGYLNRPELTAEKFVAHPFSQDPAARLYRTGDLCRWRADGNLEFLGRLDDQVKLRGFRIELGEIESVLNEHPNVAQSVVLLREDRPGDKRLVAYYVLAAGAAVTHSELKRHLRSRLPDYMVPGAYVALESFPRTPSGKIDRRALPAPDGSLPDLESEYAAPRDSVEEQLAAIWREVLEVDRVGVHDNFFDLGGHSLTAIRIVSRVEREFDVDVPLRTVFDAPTVAEMAQWIIERPLDDNEDV